MLRIFARAQSGQVQTRRPFWKAGDHDRGGGMVGTGAWQLEQSVMRSASFIPSG